MVGILMCLSGCHSNQQMTAASEITPTTMKESDMNPELRISNLRFNKAYFRPGEDVHLYVEITGRIADPSGVKAQLTVSHLSQVLDVTEQGLDSSDGTQTLDFVIAPPRDTPRGYGADLRIVTTSGDEIARASTAFDVLENWTQSPRYGFLTDFQPSRDDIQEIIETLTQYHINGLQFYDWMYRHDHFLTEQDPYKDPLGRLLSRATIDALITAAHDHNIAAMPYTAIYAASIPFFETHPDWALYQANGKPARLGEDFLVYMDPRPDSPWVTYLLDQFEQVLQETDFDGIHLDQYGDPKQGYDIEGNRFDLAEPLAATINATKNLVDRLRPDGAVVFNAVNDWPIETVARSNQDFIYIEVWPPHIWYQDLHELIVKAQELGDHKPVILAAYIDPSLTDNALLMDAVIFASGGGHIEIGEDNGLLSDPYFPKYGAMTPDMALAMRRYYDFAVRYQDVIGPRTFDVTKEFQGRIEIEGRSTDPRLLVDKVYPIVRRSPDALAISLINLLGINSPEWSKPIQSSPQALEAATITIRGIEEPITHVWFASPDGSDLDLQPIEFSETQVDDERTILFQIPSLAYWDLVLIKWGE